MKKRYVGFVMLLCALIPATTYAASYFSTSTQLYFSVDFASQEEVVATTATMESIPVPATETNQTDIVAEPPHQPVESSETIPEETSTTETEVTNEDTETATETSSSELPASTTDSLTESLETE